MTADLELLEMQVEALFSHDQDGRIRRVNEPDGEPAPRFFFGRTRAGNFWRMRHDVPARTAAQMEWLAAAEPVHDDLRAAPRRLDAMRGALGSDRRVLPVESGPAYRFPDNFLSSAASPASPARISTS